MCLGIGFCKLFLLMVICLTLFSNVCVKYSLYVPVYGLYINFIKEKPIDFNKKLSQIL